jgi:NADPH:quinone reductase-like Zn-dependent oxidoreductase
MLNKKVIGYKASVDTEKLDYFRELIESGKIKSVIDKVYPLNQVAEAHRDYEKGHTKGKIVISVID